LSENVLILIQVVGWTVGLMNVIVGAVLSIVLHKYIPALLAMWRDIDILKKSMVDVEGDVAIAVKENIPELYGVLHDMDKKLAVVIDRMPKRRSDPEQQKKLEPRARPSFQYRARQQGT
jgi:hypothetical protein